MSDVRVIVLEDSGYQYSSSLIRTLVSRQNANIQVRLFEEIREAEAFDYDLPDLARKCADHDVELLRRMVPELDAALGSGSFLQAYKNWLVYKYQGEVSRVVRALRASRDASEIYIQSSLPAMILANAGIGIREDRKLHVETFSGIEAESILGLTGCCSRWRGSGTWQASRFCNGVAFLVGTSSEAEWMASVAQRLPTSVPVNFVLKRKSQDLTDHLRNSVRNRNVSVGAWRGLGAATLNDTEVAGVERALEAFEQYLRGDSAERLRHHGKWVPILLDIAVGAIGLRRWLSPQIIIGSMEKSPQGHILSWIAPELGLLTFNVQHGNIGRQRALDLSRFDIFGIWRDDTRKLLLHDGYPLDARVEVVGIPKPEQGEQARGHPRLDELRNWSKQRRIVTLFLQPVKAPYVSLERLDEVVGLLRDFVRSHKDQVLIIKPHPSNTLTEIERWKDLLRQDENISFVDGDRTLTRDILGLTDVVVSLSSTVLTEGVAYGRKAVAYDPSGVIQLSKLDIPSQVRIARTSDELLEVIASVSSEIEPILHPTNFVDRVSNIICETLMPPQTVWRRLQLHTWFPLLFKAPATKKVQKF